MMAVILIAVNRMKTIKAIMVIKIICKIKIIRFQIINSTLNKSRIKKNKKIILIIEKHRAELIKKNGSMINVIIKIILNKAKIILIIITIIIFSRNSNKITGINNNNKFNHNIHCSLNHNNKINSPINNSNYNKYNKSNIKIKIIKIKIIMEISIIMVIIIIIMEL